MERAYPLRILERLCPKSCRSGTQRYRRHRSVSYLDTGTRLDSHIERDMLWDPSRQRTESPSVHLIDFNPIFHLLKISA
jgi:hypothetical protein